MAQPFPGNNSQYIRHNWSLEEIIGLLELPLNDLIYHAQYVHREFFDPNSIQLSTLVNIKSGGCPEDCAYCPQSARYHTGVNNEPLMDKQHVMDAARQAQEQGASRFCMGAAWRNPKPKDLEKVCELVAAVKSLGMETCATLGMLTDDQALSLKQSGLDFYNHNLDSSERFYKEIITTRTYADRLQTLDAVRKAGLHVCCGGIIGMGETVNDRAEMLQVLATMDKHPESVPINLLVRVEGTPLAKTNNVDPFDMLRVIAAARVTMPASYVRLSAGRTEMNDEFQALCFLAGANSIFYGEKLLTTSNPELRRDRELFKRLGLTAL